MTSITAHGAILTVTDAGVQVARTPMGQTLLPAALNIRAEDLRGWYPQAPTATSPGWIQFSLAYPPADAVARPIRGYPATHGVSTVVAFAPGQAEAFAAASNSLIALQGGYPVDRSAAPASAGDATVAEADVPGEAQHPRGTAGSTLDRNGASTPLSLFELPDPSEGNGASGTSADSPTSPAGKGSSPRRPRGTQDSWRRVSTPDTVPEPNLTADADGPVFGQNVTITGDFEPYEKGEVWDMIAAAGGTIGKNVTKKTTMLILGDWGSVTSKEKRARELKEKGQDITIWTFNEFLSALGKTPRPAFAEVKGTDAPF